MRVTKKTSSIATARRARRGFTLVELIVVLTIIAILAAIGVASAIGYIEKSKFEKNEQYAITAYQTAQTAISQKVENGTINAWARALAQANSLDVSGLDSPDKSSHKTIAISHFPTSTDDEVYKLLYSYYYDQTVFTGTITLVLDITATGQGEGLDPYYSANVVAAFYSLQNTGSSWDASYIHTHEGSTREPAEFWNALPCTDFSCRRNQTYVGFFDGTELSVIGPAGVSPVILPMSTLPQTPTEHVVGPAVDSGVDTTGYLFNLRNGETLDITWAVFDVGNKPDTNKPQHGENITINLYADTVGQYPSAADGGVRNPTPLKTFTITSGMLPNFNSASATVTHEFINNMYEVTRSSYLTTITIGGTKYPLTITRVVGDTRRDCPAAENPDIYYYTYTISIDWMLIRSDANDTATALLGNTPQNICATIQGSATYTDYSNGNAVHTRNIPQTFAARAMDDPVYRTGVSRRNTSDGFLTYSYQVDVNTGNGAAKYDDKDDNTDPNSIITGRCVVNTLFGDKVYVTGTADLSYANSVGGTNVSTSGGSAVITSFRHLYNIRRMRGISAPIDYRIVSDLNWYYHNRYGSGDSVVDLYASEVEVFNTSVVGHSPYEGNSLRVVSFPALHELRANETLSAWRTYSINNVQMRAGAFVYSGSNMDAGFGLICNNLGTIYNIYTNNLNIVLTASENSKDGKASDYASIACGSMTINMADKNPLANKPIGGLVALNSANGIIGQADGHIVMNNTIIIAGASWTEIGKYQSGTGGVVGQTLGAMYGDIELAGSFAIVGRDKVGGVIGYAYNTTLEARLIVNGGISNSSEIVLPAEGHSGTAASSCIIAGKNAVGGAVGWAENVEFSYSSSNYSYTTNPDTGIAFTGVTDNDYQVDVNLSGHSVVLLMKAFKPSKIDEIGCPTCGGAFGVLKKASGDDLYIRVRNEGRITVDELIDCVYQCGGAVGLEYYCTFGSVYVDVTNTSGSYVGYSGSTTNRSVSAGGAYGLILSNTAGRTMAINVSNGGTVRAKGGAGNIGANAMESADFGVGGAIGGTKTANTMEFLINVRNNQGSLITDHVNDNINTNDGVGGAIGSMYHDGTSVLSSDSVIHVTNSGKLFGYYRVGGAIGNAPTNYGRIYAVNASANSSDSDSARIEGSSFVGGVIGYSIHPQYGTVQSVINGANISGYYYVGGAAGCMQQAYNSSYVTTIVRSGSSTITGTGSLVGGVVGDLNLIDDGNTGSISLVGDGTAPTINVTGQNDIGGAVGLIRSQNSEVTCNLNMPTQTGTDRLIMNITGTADVGGAVGQIRSCTLGITSSFTDTVKAENRAGYNINVPLNVVIHPSSQISSTGTNVGGAVGRISALSGSQCIGVIRVSLATGSVANGAKISGDSNVGGAVGIFENCYPTNTTGIVVDLSAPSGSFPIIATKSNGDANVGGAVGYFSGTTNKTDLVSPISVTLGAATVTAESGYNAGGAIGKNALTNGTNVLFGNPISVTISSTISGVKNVGGVIGFNGAYVSSLSATINGTVKGSGIDESGSINGNVGGVIGYNYAPVSTIDSTINGGGRVIGGSVDESNNIVPTSNNVGGAVGYNTAAISSTTTVHLNAGGIVAGVSNVGGAFGYNFKGSLNTVNVTVNGSVSGNGSCVGGAIGHNHSSITLVTSVINGSVSAVGDDAGGAIGFADSDHKNYWITEINSTVQGTGSVSGHDNVGGAIGRNVCNIHNVYANITGASHVTGNIRVGGAVGFASAQKGQTGDEVAKGNRYGLIELVRATITADRALQGVSRMGGAIGQIGDKMSSAEGDYISAAVTEVEAVLNAAYLFDPLATGVNGGEACIGGVVGIFVDGRVTRVILSGTGGAVNISQNDPDYQCPEISASNSVIIAAKGNSLGGIVGQIGLEGFQQNVCLSNISVRSGTPNLYVISLSGDDRIGGWIGCGYGAHGGIGFNKANEYKTNIEYTVSNVRMVFSRGSEVGGFCGRLDGYNGNRSTNRGTYANINVDLNNTTVTGASATGGAFGTISDIVFSQGYVTVSLNDHTNIGDLTGNATLSVNNSFDPICYEAGGAVGFVEYINAPSYNDEMKISIPITVTVDSTSRIWAGANRPDNSTYYGVGGAFGRCQSDFTNTAVVQVLPAAGSSTLVNVYSASSDAGGFAGVMLGGTMSYTGNYNNADNYDPSIPNSDKTVYVNANVSSDGANACVGGFIGRMLGGTATYTHADGTVRANGTNSHVGGYVGEVTAGTISYCYSTDTVLSSGSRTGGFVGSHVAGTINNCYVGGHTYSGEYLPALIDIRGVTNVGGFAGLSESGTVQDCYSTASVSGTDSVGGFVGYAMAGSASRIKSCYCTGLVLGSTTVGTFVGTGNTSLFNSDQALTGVNEWPRYGNTDSTDGIALANVEEIHGSASNRYAAYPFDNTLVGSDYPFRAVIRSRHYGDWPATISGDHIITEFVLEDIPYYYQQSGVLIDDHIVVYDENHEIIPSDAYKINYIDGSNRSVGTARFVITAVNGKGYTGALTGTFTILPADVSSARVTVLQSTYDYTGAPIDLQIEVVLGSDTLVLNRDYYLTFDPDDINVGDVTFIVHGKEDGGNYTGSVDTDIYGNILTFTINGAPITPDDIELTHASEQELVYTGSGITPGVVVNVGGRQLVEGTDYRIDYVNNVNVGTKTASVVVYGMGSYRRVDDQGQDIPVIKEFSIYEADNSWTVVPAIANWVYGEEPSSPTGDLQFGYEIDPDTGAVVVDRRVFLFYTDDTYAVQIDPADLGVQGAGTYVMTAAATADEADESHPNPNYRAIAATVVPFAIECADISNTNRVSLSAASVVYDGQPHTPTISGTFTDYRGVATQLVEGTDYTVTLPTDPMVDAGEYTITITGIGNFAGSSTTVTFEITKADLANVISVEVNPDTYEYDGSTPVVPNVEVTYLGDLRPDCGEPSYSTDDFTVPGVVTVTVTATDTTNYTGSVEATFTITVPDPAPDSNADPDQGTNTNPNPDPDPDPDNPSGG